MNEIVSKYRQIRRNIDWNMQSCLKWWKLQSCQILWACANPLKSSTAKWMNYAKLPASMNQIAKLPASMNKLRKIPWIKMLQRCQILWACANLLKSNEWSSCQTATAKWMNYAKLPASMNQIAKLPASMNELRNAACIHESNCNAAWKDECFYAWKVAKLPVHEWTAQSFQISWMKMLQSCQISHSKFGKTRISG